MPDLRDMQILTALDRHSHFARAAEACGISQPAFSARIRNMETELGIPLVKRGNRFLGFTPEGDTVLRWARKMLADAEGLRQEVEVAKGALSGRVAIGTVPTALAYAASLPARLRAMHPGLTIEIRSLNSKQIHRGLDDLSLDAGITYLDEEMPVHLTPRPLYEEHYVLVAPPALVPRLTGTASWAETAALPLCLLTRDMRNRRILDEIFVQSVGRAPRPAMETNAFTAALAQVASGGMATVAPAMLVEALPPPAPVVRLAIDDPPVSTAIGLLTADRDPVPPTVLALLHALGANPR